MDRLDNLIESHPLPTWRSVAWTIMVLITLALIWSFYAELDEVTVAEGSVVPKGDLKVIQHLEGGIIKSIGVREGSAVKKGQVLLELDRASSGLNKQDLIVRLDSQIVLQARLEAEATAKTPSFPGEVRARHPKLVSAQQKTFDARQRELRSTLRVLSNQISQRELEVAELVSKKRSADRNFKLAKERLKDSADLLKQKLVPRMEHLKLEAEVEDLESESNSMKSAIPRTQAGVEEAKTRQTETKNRFSREARDELGNVEEAIARLKEELNVAGERGARLQIRSPIDGIVKNIRYSTTGGVVKPGGPIMEIVPTGEKLIIDAKLNPIDRGFVQVGQPARVKISPYNFVQYGAFDGKVTLVAADSTEDPDKGSYFQVQVETDKTYLGSKEGELPISAGMQATVDIHTGKKTVIDFLVKPVLKMKAEAFRER